MAYENVGRENKYNLPAITIEKATAIIVVASLVLLFLIARGFRGLSVGGVNLSVN